MKKLQLILIVLLVTAASYNVYLANQRSEVRSNLMLDDIEAQGQEPTEPKDNEGPTVWKQGDLKVDDNGYGYIDIKCVKSDDPTKDDKCEEGLSIRLYSQVSLDDRDQSTNTEERKNRTPKPSPWGSESSSQTNTQDDKYLMNFYYLH